MGEPLEPPKSSWDSDCIETGVVLRHEGEHGFFADVSAYGDKGCFLNDCTNSDKFDAADRAVCARLCAELEGCTYWTFGPQEGVLKCFLRKSDAARQQAPAWSSGSKACVPSRIPPAFAALTIANNEALKACDAGKSETCPDVLMAVNTWRLMFKFLNAATHNRVDGETISQIERIQQESWNVAAAITGDYRPSESPPDFGRTVYNNRLVINSLRDWLEAHPKAEFRAGDHSLPSPLRTGKLCGRTPCFCRRRQRLVNLHGRVDGRSTSCSRWLVSIALWPC